MSMTVAIGACLVLLLALVAMRRGRAATAKPAVKGGDALDQGLRYLIKDVTRAPADHEPALTPLSAPRRTPRGTPSDSVLLSARLPATIPAKDDGIVRLASTGPSASSSMPVAHANEASARARVPSGGAPVTRAPSSDDFDDEAPTTALARDDDR